MLTTQAPGEKQALRSETDFMPDKPRGVPRAWAPHVLPQPQSHPPPEDVGKPKDPRVSALLFNHETTLQKLSAPHLSIPLLPFYPVHLPATPGVSQESRLDSGKASPTQRRGSPSPLELPAGWDASDVFTSLTGSWVLAKAAPFAASGDPGLPRGGVCARDRSGALQWDSHMSSLGH